MNSGPATWLIELTGSEIARIEQQGADIVVVLAAARVNGDRRQLASTRSGGHLLGVSWHLSDTSWVGQPSDLIGRIDEADWRSGSHSCQPHNNVLEVPSSGDSPAELTLKTALGDALVVRAQSWRVELPASVRFVPSLAC